MTLQEKMMQGFRLNPESMRDREMFRVAKNYKTSVEWSKVAERTGEALAHITEGIIMTLPSMVEATVYPEWNWSKEWQEPTGKNLET